MGLPGQPLPPDRFLLFRFGIFAEVGQDLEVGAGGLGDGLRMPGIDGREVHEIAPHSECARAGLDEAGCSFQRNAAGGDQLEYGNGASNDFR